MPSVIRISARGKAKDFTAGERATLPADADLDVVIPLIQALIPLGLQAFAELIQAEVAQFAGAKYSRIGGAPEVVR